MSGETSFTCQCGQPLSPGSECNCFIGPVRVYEDPTSHVHYTCENEKCPVYETIVSTEAEIEPEPENLHKAHYPPEDVL